MAKPTKFVAACKRIQGAIERATANGTGGHKRRKAMERELALWAATDHSGNSYARLAELRLPWKRWDEELYWPGMQVACALYLMTRNKFSRARAVSATNVKPADLTLALSLLKSAGLSHESVVKEQHEEVETLVASAVERLHVSIEARALEDLLLSVAEGYQVSPGKDHKYTEVFGLCFGSVRTRTFSRDQSEHLVHISRVATQLRAKGNASSVLPNEKSLSAQLDIGERFFRHLEMVGDYHSHPYRTLAELKQAQGWEYSDADEASMPGFIEDLRDRRHSPRFSLVVAVARGGKASRRPVRFKRNVIQVPVGNLFFVIGCYRVLLDASYDEEVTLDVPSMVA